MGASDLPAIANLLRATRSDPPGGEHPTLWLFRRVAEGELAGTVRLWPGRTAALLLDGVHLVFLVRPGPDAERAAGELFAWALDAAPEVVTQASSWDGDRLALLDRHGFVADGKSGVRMARPLSDDLAAPEPPPGLELRAVAGGQELAAYLTLFRAAFGDGPSADSRRRLWGNREYRRDLDLVAVAPDGRLVGFCLAFLYGEDNAALSRRDGWIEQMGTHPDYRRQGVGRALLRAGLHALRRHGAADVYLETGDENHAAQALYSAEGFRPDASVLRYRKHR